MSTPVKSSTKPFPAVYELKVLAFMSAANLIPEAAPDIHSPLATLTSSAATVDSVVIATATSLPRKYTIFSSPYLLSRQIHDITLLLFIYFYLVYKAFAYLKYFAVPA
jgi:hypothetical protein